MSDQNLDQTQPAAVPPAEDKKQETPTSGEKKPKSRTWQWIVGGILAMIIIGGLGALAGYYAGIENRKAIEQGQRTLAATTQFQLGMADMQAGRYDFAKQRFEYVIQVDPAFPGVLENMAKLTIIMNATATPVVLPTFTPAPTLDLSGVESMLAQAKQFLAAQDFDNTITTLDSIRKQNPTFKTLEVDGMYYRAYRGRGIVFIIQKGELEQGIYNFAMARLFGPTDKEANDAEAIAKMYLNAARYFGWDWEKAVGTLGELYQTYPSMIDSSGRSVADRYREVLFRYGDLLYADDKYCKAVSYYDQSLGMGTDQKDIPEYGKASRKCIESLPTATPTIDPNIPTETPPTEEVPTEEPTAEGGGGG